MSSGEFINRPSVPPSLRPAALSPVGTRCARPPPSTQISEDAHSASLPTAPCRRLAVAGRRGQQLERSPHCQPTTRWLQAAGTGSRSQCTGFGPWLLPTCRPSALTSGPSGLTHRAAAPTPPASVITSRPSSPTCRPSLPTPRPSVLPPRASVLTGRSSVPTRRPSAPKSRIFNLPKPFSPLQHRK